MSVPMSSNASRSTLQAVKVRLQFGGVVALNDVSLDVHDDELLAIIGPNGAGKTSLINCLSGFYRPTAGEFCWTGETYAAVRYIALPEGLARTFQGTHLFSGHDRGREHHGRPPHPHALVAWPGLCLFPGPPAGGDRTSRGGRGDHRIPRDRIDPPQAGRHARLRAAQACRPRARAGAGAEDAADGRADGRHEHRREGGPGPLHPRRARGDAHPGRAGRARHGRGDGSGRPHRGARLRHARSPRARRQEIQRDPR